MVEDHFSIAGVFWSEMCTKHCKEMCLYYRLDIEIKIKIEIDRSIR